MRPIQTTARRDRSWRIRASFYSLHAARFQLPHAHEDRGFCASLTSQPLHWYRSQTAAAAAAGYTPIRIRVLNLCPTSIGHLRGNEKIKETKSKKAKKKMGTNEKNNKKGYLCTSKRAVRVIHGILSIARTEGGLTVSTFLHFHYIKSDISHWKFMRIVGRIGDAARGVSLSSRSSNTLSPGEEISGGTNRKMDS